MTSSHSNAHTVIGFLVRATFLSSSDSIMIMVYMCPPFLCQADCMRLAGRQCGQQLLASLGSLLVVALATTSERACEMKMSMERVLKIRGFPISNNVRNINVSFD